MDKIYSLLSPIGYSNNSCGYCHSKSGSFSYYASTTSLSTGFYQCLLNRGWRRSGSLLYKPDQLASCCPQYTIRLDSELFHASKDQRQALNRFNKHILGDSYIKDTARFYPRSREQAKKRNAEFDLVERVHEGENGHLKPPPEPAYSLTVTLEPDEFTEEKYILFENYQRLVHHEPPHRISRPGFKKFLCNSPLPRSAEKFDGRERRLGSYHQCYRIDGTLVAMGVLDLLPQCVSAVYFIYHESVHQHGFGKVGALREIALAKEEGYRWWYAGFYIHSCIKMRYKGDYTPQYMLDPGSYNWDPLDDEMKKRLDSKKFVSLSLEQAASSAAAPLTPTPPANPTDDSTDTDMNDPDFDGQSDEEDGPVPDPEKPIFERSIPGILTKEQIFAEVDLDHIKIRVRDTEAETGDLVSWETGDMGNTRSIKGIIAELVAAVGAEAAGDMIVYFG